MSSRLTNHEAAFEKAFWRARRFSHKGLFDQSLQAYKDAEMLALKAELPHESIVCRAARQHVRGQHEDAENLLSAVLATSRKQWLRAIAHFVLSSVHYHCGKYKLTITHLKQALDIPSFRKRIWALNNIAETYAAMGEHEKALKFFDRALSEINLHQDKEILYIVLHSKALIYLRMGRTTPPKTDLFQCAAEHLVSAIDSMGDGDILHTAVCHRELGTCHWLLGDREAARRCWDKAYETYKVPCLRKINEYASGVTLEKIRLSEIPLKQLRTEEVFVLEWTPQSELLPIGLSSPEEELFSKIVTVSQDVYQEYLARPSFFTSDSTAVDNINRSLADCTSLLMVLRGWGSAVPMLRGFDSAVVGGGYYLRHQEVGIAIDPGYQFVQNLLTQGLHLRDIDAIITSHNHPDHNDDLWTLDDLRYEMFNRAPASERSLWSYDLFLDSDTRKDWDLTHKLSEDSYPAWFHARRVRTIRGNGTRMSYQRPDSSAETLSMVCDKAIHTSEVPGAVCMQLQLPSDSDQRPILFGYTGDTEFRDELIDSKSVLYKCDVLLVHVSNPSRDELLSTSRYKSTHLGFRGAASLIAGTQPQLALIGEFWGGKGDWRIDIVEGLRRCCRGVCILPAGLGLAIDLQANQCMCTKCNAWTDVNEVFVCGSEIHYGKLNYLCESCYCRNRETVGRFLPPLTA